MIPLPPFVLTRTATKRHLPSALLGVREGEPRRFQVLCNVSLRAFDPASSLRPFEWVRWPALVAHPERLPVCVRCLRRAAERDSGRSSDCGTVPWGAADTARHARTGTDSRRSSRRSAPETPQSA